MITAYVCFLLGLCVGMLTSRPGPKGEAGDMGPPGPQGPAGRDAQ
jgi:hypothetical protein